MYNPEEYCVLIIVQRHGKYYVVKFDFEEATWKCALYCHPDDGFKSLEEAFDIIVMIELHISYIDGGVVV